MKTFVESQFGYCSIIWMFYSRKASSKMNYLHVRSLRIVYDDYVTSFEDLLKKDNSLKTNHKNIQTLATELFKVKKGLANPILCHIFPLRIVDYNLRSQTDFSVSSVNTSHFGLNSLRYFASKVWNLVPFELNLNDAEMFRSETRKWDPRQCECKLCLPYVHNTGYADISKN